MSCCNGGQIAAIIHQWPVLLPVFANDTATIIFTVTALNARVLTQFPQPSCRRDVELHHTDTCSLIVATKVVSQLPWPTGKQKRARYIPPPIISNQSTSVLYELMCWLSLVVRSPPARRSLSWIQSTVDWCMAPRKWGFDLKSNSTNYPDHGHHGDHPPNKENPHGRAGNRTRELVICSQKLWPLDHE